ncbi:MAG: GNAT family N-acetyltransferase [Trebonia sp.]
MSFPDPPLTADGILLRRPEASDVPWITAACSHPEIHRWVPAIPYPYSEADARAFVERGRDSWEHGKGGPFAITDAASGEGLGMTGLHLFADEGLGEVGYWLRREARGRGAATIATRLVVRWAFGTVGVERMNLETDPANSASQRVAERAGFTREGLLRAWLPTPEGRRDSLMFSLLAADLPTGPPADPEGGTA